MIDVSKVNAWAVVFDDGSVYQYFRTFEEADENAGIYTVVRLVPHSLLVKACVEIARRMVDESPLTLAEITACIKEDYGIDLRYTREGWKEDVTK